MSNIFHQVLSDSILLGTIVLAVFVNLAALGLKWQRERTEENGVSHAKEAL